MVRTMVGKGISDRNDFLKIIGMIAMLIDHIGYIFFPEHIILRIMGRIAFPIFAYHISVGYIHTKDIKRYILRLFIFGAISQIPYRMLFQGGLNIFFTLLLGLVCIYALDHHRYILLILFALLPLFLNFEYGYYGLALIIIFHLTKNSKNLSILGIGLINLWYFLSNNYSIQIFSILALLPIYTPLKIDIRWNKYIFYVFYPMHIVILYYLKGTL